MRISRVVITIILALAVLIFPLFILPENVIATQKAHVDCGEGSNCLNKQAYPCLPGCPENLEQCSSFCSGGGTLPGCFPAGTQITLAPQEITGQAKVTKNIEDIKPGDKVLSQDETGKQTVSTVQNLLKPVSNNMCTIRYTDGESLDVTNGHPLFTQNGWKAIDPVAAATEDPGVPVTRLTVGDFMTKADHVWPQISNISCKDEAIQTYNLVVDNAHTYFAGGFLAHNKGQICDSCGNLSNGIGILPLTGTSNSFTINWYTDVGGANQACWNNNYYYYVIDVGTDFNQVNGACNGIDGNYDYRGQGSALPWGCQATRVIPNEGATSFNTAAANITLSPQTIYYARIRFMVSHSWDTDDNVYGECAYGQAPYMGTCSLNPSSKTMNVGDTQTFTTGAFSGENLYVHPTSVTGVYFQPQVCVSWNTRGNCNGTIGPYYLISGDLGNPPDTPHLTVIHNGTTYFNGTHALSGANQIKLLPGEISPSYSGDLATSDITVSYPPPSPLTANNNVDYVKYSEVPTPGYISINPTTDSTDPYQTAVKALQQTLPATTLKSQVFAQNISYPPACTSNAQITINPAASADPWWQVKDGDVQTNGDITSKVPGSNVFDLPGAGNFAGVPAYGGGTDLTTTNVSAQGWLANSPWSSPKVFDYAYFANQIPSGTTINPITAIDQTTIDAGTIDAATGYYWYKYDGSANGLDLSLDSVLAVGDKKVILLVNSANFNINSTINLNGGFFMVIVNGNIVVNPSVGGGAAALQGLYVADGTFSDGTVYDGSGNPPFDIPLVVRGSVAVYGGVSLQRNLGPANTTTPGELFEYDPSQIMLFPKVLATRKINWKEVAP